MTPTEASSAASASDPIRVMVVDDSAVIRGLLTRTLESDPNIRVVSSVGNGQMAINALRRQDVEVVVLDIEMPVMDGMAALPKLLEADPQLQIIMASTLTRRNAAISLQCLELGAKDYLPKPSSTGGITATAGEFRHELIGKVTALGGARRRMGPARPRPAAPAARPAPAAAPAAPRRLYGDSKVTLRNPSTATPEILVIGSSTGGPQALFKVMGDLRAAGTFKLPILITQHMPATFTTILAEHLTTASGRPAAEAKDGESIEPGRIYVAPGDFHMVVEGRGGTRKVRLNQDAPENFCRPAVDPLFRSVAASYGNRALAVILTGMGQDGLKGARNLTDAGSTLIAQDEPTSVVWGMPGAVATNGLCSAVLPLPEIAGQILKLAGRSGR